jgi:hypothetical protein
MLFSGYIQSMCGNGHLFETDPYQDLITICPCCGKDIILANLVDNTNGLHDGRIEFEMIKEKYYKMGIYPREAIYRIPMQKELDSIQDKRVLINKVE